MAINVDEIIKAIEAKRLNNTLTQPQSQTDTHLDVAKYILANANVDWNKISNKGVAANRDTSGPSVISRIFDILSRPNYAVANTAKAAVTGNQDLLSALWRGLAGQDKTTFSQLMQDNNPGSDDLATRAVAGAEGFAMDLLLDPTTYLGPGLIKGIGKAVGIGGKTAEEALAAIPSNPQVLGINKIPAGLSQAPQSAQHFNLSSKISDLAATVPDTSKPFNPAGYVPKTVDVALDSFKTSPVASQQLATIDKTSKNMARQRYKNEEIAALKNTPEGVTPENIQKLNLWMMENFPKSGTSKFKEVSEGIEGKPITSVPMATGVMKADDLIAGIKDGNPSAIAEAQFNEAHRADVLAGVGNFGKSEVAQAQAIADKFVKDILDNPNKFSAKAAKFNTAEQANLASRIWKFTKLLSNKNPDNFNVFRMLRTAEDHLISKGFNPSFWDGSHIRMTDVIMELADNGDDIPRVMQDHLTQVMTAFRNKNQTKVTDPLVAQAIENLRAKSAIVEAPKVSKAIDEASKLQPVAEQVLSTPKYQEFVKKLGIESENVLHAQNASTSAVSAAKSAINALLTPNTTLPLQATQTKRIYIMNYMQNGSRTSWEPVRTVQSRAIANMQGFSYPTVASKIGAENKALTAVMSRIATWWGQKELRPEVLIKTMTATANAGARARVWNTLAKQFSDDELADGFRVAQSNIPMGAATENVNKVAAIFEKAMQNLFDSSGLTKEALAGSSVATRSGMVMQDINKQLELLKAPFRFRNDRRIDPMGNVIDYSKGTDWLKSWQAFNTDSPLEFMFKVETAVEQLMQKYAFLDEAATRWGSSVRTNEFSEKIDLNISKYDQAKSFNEWPKATLKGVPVKARRAPERPNRLDGTFFPRDVAEQLRNALSTWDQIYNPQSKLIKFMDKVTRAWKAGVTIYAPSHHIRNFIGDVYLSWMAGVNNPAVYTKAGKVLFSQKDRYGDLETVENLVGQNALSRALTRPGDVITTTRSGHKLTAEQIYIAAHNTGLLPHVDVVEELFGDPLIKFQPLGGRAKNIAHKVSENREHYVRLAHFIDTLEKSKEKNLKLLFDSASKVVRKWHPDGSDLTGFERNVLRRLLPFYSWTRKSIPLLIESALTNPGKTLVYPKFMEAMQGVMGIDAPSRTDPFPYDQLFPDWIKEKGIGPIAEHGMSGLPGFIAGLSRSTTGFTGDPSGYTVVNPSNPLVDVVSQFAGMGRPSDPIKGIGQMLTPALKIPSEVLHGQTFNGVPIEAGRYIAENIPVLSVASRLTNLGAFGPTIRGEKEGIFNPEAFWNWLSALGIQGTGPYIKTAEFQERDRRRAANGQ